MPTTFLTGGNGFVGATVLDQLLAKDYKVIAAVRAQSSGDKILSVHPEWDKSRITFVEIPDFTASGAFDSAFRQYPEIDYIIHVAAPVFAEGNTDFVEHYEKPAVEGNISLLQAAKQHGRNVKAVAVTGSINAITTGDQNDIKSRFLDSTQWLPMGKEDALKTDVRFVSRPYLYYLKQPLMNRSTDMVLRRQKAFGSSNLVFCRVREAVLHGDRLQPPTSFRPNATVR